MGYLLILTRLIWVCKKSASKWRSLSQYQVQVWKKGGNEKVLYVCNEMEFYIQGHPVYMYYVDICRVETGKRKICKQIRTVNSRFCKLCRVVYDACMLTSPYPKIYNRTPELSLVHSLNLLILTHLMSCLWCMSENMSLLTSLYPKNI